VNSNIFLCLGFNFKLIFALPPQIHVEMVPSVRAQTMLICYIHVHVRLDVLVKTAVNVVVLLLVAFHASMVVHASSAQACAYVPQVIMDQHVVHVSEFWLIAFVKLM
jgi:hypothetical protein